MTVNTVVFDFETASKQRDAALLSLGGFAFNRYNLEEVKETIKARKHYFYQNFDLTNQFFDGFHLEQDTAKWWRERNSNQIPEVLVNRVDLKEGLLDFNDWIKSFPKDTLFFSRHTHADYIWYENACKLLGIRSAISYNRIYDTCSVVLLAYNEPKGYVVTGEERNAHNALGDCLDDALQIAMCFDSNIPKPAYKG